MTTAVGAATLAGWWLNIPVLQRGFTTAGPMHPVTAAVYVCSGIALWIAGGVPAAPWLMRVGRGAAIAVLALSLLGLARQLFGRPAAIDQLLFHSRLVALGNAGPRPFSSGSAFVFVLLGIALVTMDSPRDALRFLAGAIGLLLGLIGLLTFGAASYHHLSGTPAAATDTPLTYLFGFTAIALGASAICMRRTAAPRGLKPGEALRRRVNLALTVAVGILILTTSLSIWGASSSQRGARDRKGSDTRRASVAALWSSIQDIESGEQGYLLTGRAELLAPYHAALDSLATQLPRADSLAGWTAGETRALADLHIAIRTQLGEAGEVVALTQAGRRDSAAHVIAARSAEAVVARIRGDVTLVSAAEDSLGARWDARVTFVDRLSLLINFLAGLLAAFFLILAGRTINTDIRMRAEIEEERDRFFTLSLDMLCISRSDGYFKRLNPAFSTTLGWTTDELLHRPFLDFVHPDDHASTLREVERQVQAGEPVLQFENRYLHKDGAWRVLSWKSIPQPGGLMYATARDITGLREADAAMRRAKEAAETANRAKSDFLAKMSHELRTPLNSIIGFSEILEDGTGGPLTDKQRKYVGNVLLSGRNLLQLINDILDLSKVEAGRMELAVAEFDFAATVEQVRSIVVALAGQKSLAIRVNLPADLPRIVADESKIKQVLYNLLGNAIKFTPRGGEVTVTASLAGGPGDASPARLEVAVADTGIGIAPENQERIFNEFEQARTHGGHDEGGTGLGLALTRKLVELHGGRVWVASTLGVGSTFRFTLPLLRPSGAAAMDEPDTAPYSTASTNGAAPLVLVIDDERHASDLIAHHLAEAQYRVATASTAEEALRLARELHPDAITMDVLLPDHNGLLLLAELKADPRTRKIPVIVASVTDRRELGFSLGAVDWLVKPIDRSVLLCAIEARIRTEPPTGNPAILVIDDDIADREYVCELLAQHQFEVICASGGAAGIGMAVSRLPDLILLDLMMPEVNGFDVVRALRADPRARSIPILVLTAKELTAVDRDRLRASVQGIMAKGTPRDELLDQLAQFCPLPAERA